MMTMTTDYLAEAEALFEYTRALRRDFHQHPELGFQEVRTAAIVARELDDAGITNFQTGVAKTGVVALLEGACPGLRPGPVVLLRFDMDALPILEETGAGYASQTPGLMHACGHDGHTAIGLCVARMLAAHRDELAGTVKLVFQPAEEGLGGAALMVAEGILENPRPDYAIAAHFWNELPVNEFGITPGPIMAASETFKVKIVGKGGHGAAPHQTVDPIFATSQVIAALQSIVSRNVPPLDSAVVSVCSIQGGTAFNIVPPDVMLTGTIRTFKKEIRANVLQRFEEIVTGVAESLGCRAEIELVPVTPAVDNDPDLTAQIQAIARRLFPGCRIKSNEITMGSEDMAFMMDDIPGCFVFVGSANPRLQLDAKHHHPKFDFDEAALPKAAALVATTAAELLGAGPLGREH